MNWTDFWDPMNLLTRVPAFLFAISFHEAAHAWMAWRLGDPTAKDQGRITLNPIAHLDPVGTICILFLPFGWAKPVPVNEYNLRNPRKDGYWIAAAGPVSNMILAVIFTIIYHVMSLEPVVRALMSLGQQSFIFANTLVLISIVVNVSLAIFNLVPLFPLDGEKMLVGAVPRETAEAIESFRPYGPIVFIVLVVSGILGTLVVLIVKPILSLLIGW